MALPWAFGSWVMVFRSQPDWVERSRREGWSLLAAADLKDAWILPASPRVVMALVLQSLGQSPNTTNLSLVPGLAARLATVVRQARAFDSHHALTRVVNNHGSAAVVPSWTVIPQLLRDQRLVAVQPTTSPPLLSWQVLVRPRRAGPPVPKPWLQASTEGMVLNNLLQAGFCPPLPMAALQHQLAQHPAASLLPPRGHGNGPGRNPATLDPSTPRADSTDLGRGHGHTPSGHLTTRSHQPQSRRRGGPCSSSWVCCSSSGMARFCGQRGKQSPQRVQASPRTMGSQWPA